MPSIPLGPVSFTRYAGGHGVELVDWKFGYRWKPTQAESHLPRPCQAYQSRVFENDIPKRTKVRTDGGASEGPPPLLNNIEFLNLYVGRQEINPASGEIIGSYTNAAYARAYAKLTDKLMGDTSSLGVSVAEGREAIEGVVERAQRLGKAYKALRRGRFKSFLSQLGGRPKEKHKHTRWTRPKDASALWLEYWLAWAPLAGDIQASTKVLCEPNLIPDTYVSVRAASVLPSTFETKGVGWRSDVVVGEGRVSVGIGCKVAVSNPNTYLAARLGLTHPLSIAWAVVPFSFMIDWFANIGQVLESMTFSNCGLTVKEGWVSSNSRYTGRRTYKSYVPDSDPRQEVWKNDYIHAHRSSRRLTTSFPRVPLVVKLPNGLSPSRGATAISLLVSIFTKG